MEFSNGDCRSVWFFFLSVYLVDANINLLNKGAEAGGRPKQTPSKVSCLRVPALIIQ